MTEKKDYYLTKKLEVDDYLVIKGYNEQVEIG